MRSLSTRRAVLGASALVCLTLWSMLYVSTAVAQEAPSGATVAEDGVVVDDASGELSDAELETLCLSQPLDSRCTTVRIEAIVIEGLGRTKRRVVTRELLFEEGDYASMAQVRESVQRLLNLGLFREVDWELVSRKIPTPDGMPPELNPKRPSRVLIIRVDERWTLLPFFSFSQGGGLTSLVMGASDLNLTGRYLTLGFQYSRFGLSDQFFRLGGAANSYGVWFRQPRFLDTYTSAGLQLWSSIRLRSIYNDAGDREGGFTLQRRFAALQFQRELLPWFFVGSTLSLLDDQFSFEFLPDSIVDAQTTNFGGPPESLRSTILRGYMRFGRVNRDDFYYDGWSVNLSMAHADKVLGGDTRFSTMSTAVGYYKKLPLRSNLAFRALGAFTNAEEIQFQNYIGGLDRVRGYRDSRFRGPMAWSANLEYRVAPLARPWFTLQGVTFVDGGAAADSITGLGQFDALSVGGGVRVISPKIYSFVARLDYAYPLINGTGGNISFGAQQFF